VLATLQRRLNEAEDDEHREKLEIYQSEKQCPACHGTRLRPESRAVTVCGRTIVEVMAMSVKDCLAHFRSVDLPSEMKEVHKEILKRLQFLDDVGLDYLTLDRPSSSLSGGEMQRIRLATQIGSGLTGVLYVLDEPTIGLHPRDNERLIATLKGLRDKGNTVVIVEHDEEMMRTADYIIDLGPGAGREGGKVMYQGDFEGLLKCGSLTSDYLTGKKVIKAISLCGGMGSCRPTNKSCLDLKLNSGAGDSPFCSMHLVKSHEDALSLGGVPVLSLISSKPSLSSDSERRFAAGRLSPPDSSTS
jgi:excinuclease ABC subunit A